jgi:predicted nucleotidyltransferase component of viral defense system
MLNIEKHQLIMGRILRDIYTDISIASLLGFKGGTCAYFFYNLPRFSVDLDFDLLKNNEIDHELIFNKIEQILKTYGEIKDSCIKQNTIFFLLSYGGTDHNIKIEINIRIPMLEIRNYFELKEYLGISMFVAKKSYLFANKLVALTRRNTVAMRDIYDIWYFAKNNWDIDKEIIEIYTNKNIKEYLADCIVLIDQVKDSQILHTLGELLNEKEKIWVKNNLKKEVLFLLKNYISVLI